MEWELLFHVVAVVVIVVVVYWAIYLPNPMGLDKAEATSRIMVRVLAVIVMGILAVYLLITTLSGTDEAEDENEPVQEEQTEPPPPLPDEDREAEEDGELGDEEPAGITLPSVSLGP